MFLSVLASYYTHASEVTNINEDVEDEDLQEIDDDKDTSKQSKHPKKTSDNNDAEPNNKNSEEDNKKDKDDKTKKDSNRSGWYSGLDVAGSSIKLIANETKPNKQSITYDTTKVFTTATLILGYDMLFTRIFTVGAEVGVGLNFGSNLLYKDAVYNCDVAKINPGIAFNGNVKLGFNVKSWTVYGTVGGILSKWQQSSLDNNKNNTETKYITSWSYGAGIQNQFSNNVYIRAEFNYSPSTAHADTNKQVKDCKLSDIKTTKWEIKFGTGYKF